MLSSFSFMFCLGNISSSIPQNSSFVSLYLSGSLPFRPGLPVSLSGSLSTFFFFLLTSPVSLRNHLTSSSHMLPRSFPHQDLSTKMPMEDPKQGNGWVFQNTATQSIKKHTGQDMWVGLQSFCTFYELIALYESFMISISSLSSS